MSAHPKPKPEPGGVRGTSPEQGKVQAMLERVARAVTSGDGKAAAACWQVPALLLSDAGTMAVGSLAELERLLGQARDQYNAQEIFGTRPDLRRIVPLTDRLLSLEVRWPYLDRDGRDVGKFETSTYIVRIDEGNEPKICVAVAMGASTTR